MWTNAGSCSVKYFTIQFGLSAAYHCTSYHEKVQDKSKQIPDHSQFENDSTVGSGGSNPDLYL